MNRGPSLGCFPETQSTGVILFAMLCIVLGAGFSYSAGVPLASQLFDRRPEVDRITRESLVNRVLSRWLSWQVKTGGAPEQYLAQLEPEGGKAWFDALWFVSLMIALPMGRLESIGGRLAFTRHNVNRASGNPVHEEFWGKIFSSRADVSVITTNYDILAERGLRHKPRPRIKRPGFHYGEGSEKLVGGGYPSYTHIRPIVGSGGVPLLKLHESISWSWRDATLVRYSDCRPAIRGDPAIVAPMETKQIPRFLHDTWRAAAASLGSADTWIVVGYSMPPYDEAVRNLLLSNSSRLVKAHIFDPDPLAPQRYGELLGRGRVESHAGLPDGLDDLGSI